MRKDDYVIVENTKFLILSANNEELKSVHSRIGKITASHPFFYRMWGDPEIYETRKITVTFADGDTVELYQHNVRLVQEYEDLLACAIWGKESDMEIVKSLVEKIPQKEGYLSVEQAFDKSRHISEITAIVGDTSHSPLID